MGWRLEIFCGRTAEHHEDEDEDENEDERPWRRNAKEQEDERYVKDVTDRTIKTKTKQERKQWKS